MKNLKANVSKRTLPIESYLCPLLLFGGAKRYRSAFSVAQGTNGEGAAQRIHALTNIFQSFTSCKGFMQIYANTIICDY